MNDASSAAAANSSSDFVRKLYKMLEDPSYESVVRWGNEGDSFVVLENEKFTKSILPKHFKHSNFASFVRQLNKYDFHKVRHNNEETGQSPYGAGAWEFKHPDFKANNKDALDNIRRKAPMPKKAAPNAEDMPTQQMDLVNTQLVATQSQLQSLHEKYNELSVHHGMLLQEMMNLQKTVVNHEHVIQNVMSFLHTVDAQQRRTSKVFGNPFAPHGANDGAQNYAASATTAVHDDEDESPASPLQKASNLLNEVQADEIINSRNLEQMNEMAMRFNGTISTPPPSELAFKANARQSSREPPVSASSNGTAQFGDLENVVYPIGQNNGIDPTYSEHIHNIPYPMPSKQQEAPDTHFTATSQVASKKVQYDPGWAQKPHVLLVEDDATCRRIGGKFLDVFQCTVDKALDGLEAVNKMNSGSKYDLILMDIIMPNLDGVSACHLIRQFDNTPIIAMTSNIRSDDITMYFQHGMNDVLPKPFTKEGLMSMLDKHLAHLKKDYVEPSSATRGNLKDEDVSAKGSPATIPGSWHSPAHLSAPNSVQGGMSGDDYMTAMRGSNMYGMGGMPYGSGPQTPSGPPRMQSQQQQQPHRRHISDISGGEDQHSSDSKRQQMYAPQMQVPGSR